VISESVPHIPEYTIRAYLVDHLKLKLRWIPQEFDVHVLGEQGNARFHFHSGQAQEYSLVKFQ
jgi:hypothetical protein